MPVVGGRGINGKITYIKLDDFDDNVSLMEVSGTDRDLLLILSEQLDWKNRWLEPPAPLDNDDDRDAYIAALKLRLMTVIDFCERMIACITSDTDTQQALLNWLQNELETNQNLQQQITNITYYNGNYPGLPSKPGTTGNILQPADCDKDTAAGFVMTGIVDRAFANIYQMFDIMLLAATDEQKKLAVLDAIPVLGELLDLFVVSDLVGFVANIGVWIKAQFEAEDSPALREQYYRDLLCIYMENCSLSIEQIRDYFWRKATEANSGFNDAIGTAVDLYNFLFNGTASSFVGIAPVLMGIQFGGAYFIDSLFNMPLSQFVLLAALGDPTDDWIAWEALYGECECWYEYRKPDNPIDNLTVFPTFGLTGIEDCLAVSTDDNGFFPWIITDTMDALPIVNCPRLWIITDTPDIMVYEVTIDGITYDNSTSGFPTPFYVSPGNYAMPVIFSTPVTGDIEGFNFHKTTGVPGNFKWLAVRIFEPC